MKKLTVFFIVILSACSDASKDTTINTVPPSEIPPGIFQDSKDLRTASSSIATVFNDSTILINQAGEKLLLINKTSGSSEGYLIKDLTRPNNDELIIDSYFENNHPVFPELQKTFIRDFDLVTIDAGSDFFALAYGTNILNKFHYFARIYKNGIWSSPTYIGFSNIARKPMITALDSGGYLAAVSMNEYSEVGLGRAENNSIYRLQVLMDVNGNGNLIRTEKTSSTFVDGLSANQGAFLFYRLFNGGVPELEMAYDIDRKCFYNQPCPNIDSVYSTLLLSVSGNVFSWREPQNTPGSFLSMVGKDNYFIGGTYRYFNVSAPASTDLNLWSNGVWRLTNDGDWQEVDNVQFAVANGSANIHKFSVANGVVYNVYSLISGNGLYSATSADGITWQVNPDPLNVDENMVTIATPYFSISKNTPHVVWMKTENEINSIYVNRYLDGSYMPALKLASNVKRSVDVQHEYGSVNGVTWINTSTGSVSWSEYGCCSGFYYPSNSAGVAESVSPILQSNNSATTLLSWNTHDSMLDNKVFSSFFDVDWLAEELRISEFQMFGISIGESFNLLSMNSNQLEVEQHSGVWQTASRPVPTCPTAPCDFNKIVAAQAAGNNELALAIRHSTKGQVLVGDTENWSINEEVDNILDLVSHGNKITYISNSGGNLVSQTRDYDETAGWQAWEPPQTISVAQPMLHQSSISGNDRVLLSWLNPSTKEIVAALSSAQGLGWQVNSIGDFEIKTFDRIGFLDRTYYDKTLKILPLHNPENDFHISWLDEGLNISYYDGSNWSAHKINLDTGLSYDGIEGAKYKDGYAIVFPSMQNGKSVIRAAIGSKNNWVLSNVLSNPNLNAKLPNIHNNGERVFVSWLQQREQDPSTWEIRSITGL